MKRKIEQQIMRLPPGFILLLGVLIGFAVGTINGFTAWGIK